MGDLEPLHEHQSRRPKKLHFPLPKSPPLVAAAPATTTVKSPFATFRAYIAPTEVGAPVAEEKALENVIGGGEGGGKPPELQVCVTVPSKNSPHKPSPRVATPPVEVVVDAGRMDMGDHLQSVRGRQEVADSNTKGMSSNSSRSVTRSVPQRTVVKAASRVSIGETLILKKLSTIAETVGALQGSCDQLSARVTALENTLSQVGTKSEASMEEARHMTEVVLRLNEAVQQSLNPVSLPPQSLVFNAVGAAPFEQAVTRFCTSV